MNKIKIWAIILAVMFLVTFVLGLMPVYPFGVYTSSGDLVTTKFTHLVITPIFPLIMIVNILDKLNLPEGDIELFYLIISGIVLIIYYLFLSYLIVYSYMRIKNKLTTI
jgi:hypothetical protein